MAASTPPADTDSAPPPPSPGTQAVVDAVGALPAQIAEEILTALRQAASELPADRSGGQASDPSGESEDTTEYEVMVSSLTRRDSAPDKPFKITRFKKGDPVTFPKPFMAEDRDRHLATGAIKLKDKDPEVSLRPAPPTFAASGLGGDPEREAAILTGAAEAAGATSDASRKDQPVAPK